MASAERKCDEDFWVCARAATDLLSERRDTVNRQQKQQNRILTRFTKQTDKERRGTTALDRVSRYEYCVAQRLA
jgi:hypothetical protein